MPSRVMCPALLLLADFLRQQTAVFCADGGSAAGRVVDSPDSLFCYFSFQKSRGNVWRERMPRESGLCNCGFLIETAPDEATESAVKSSQSAYFLSSSSFSCGIILPGSS